MMAVVSMIGSHGSKVSAIQTGFASRQDSPSSITTTAPRCTHLHIELVRGLKQRITAVLGLESAPIRAVGGVGVGEVVLDRAGDVACKQGMRGGRHRRTGN